MAGSPTFFSEGHDSRRADTLWKIEQKILGALNDGAGGGTSSSGIGSPEGVVTANVGSFYIDLTSLSAPGVWVKTSGTGNTGWSELIAAGP